MPADHTEKAFETAIEDHLLTHGGYIKADPQNFDRERAIDPAVLIPFIQETQPEKWEGLAKIHGADTEFLRVYELTELPHYGVFQCFRRCWVARLVEVLREAGYLHTLGDLRPVLTLTGEADDLLLNPGEVPNLPGEILEDPVLGSLWPRSDLEDRLRELRHRLGRLLQRPPRQVIADRLVRGLCRRPPQSQRDVEEMLPEAVRPHADAVWSVIRRTAP